MIANLTFRHLILGCGLIILAFSIAFKHVLNVGFPAAVFYSVSAFMTLGSLPEMSGVGQALAALESVTGLVFGGLLAGVFASGLVMR